VTVGAFIIAAGHFTLACRGCRPSSSAWDWCDRHRLLQGERVDDGGPALRAGDKRRDAGFTIFYMGTNAGAFLGRIICSYFAESPRWGWHWGFGSAGVGMIAGLITYLALRPRYLAGIGEPPDRATVAAQRAHAPLTREERDRLTAVLVLFAFTIVFWMAFEQASTSMNFFAQDRTDRQIGTFLVPAGWFQSSIQSSS
jgi:POT family proton-dependent oligopeptide transporter